MNVSRYFVPLWLLLALIPPVIAFGADEKGETNDYVPQPGVFPPANVGKYLSGELIYIDPVNRRGGIRLAGNEKNRYHKGPLHYFALLPYGTVHRHGALAELRDLPIGTHVHGYFLLPPVGEEETIPPLPEDQAGYEVAHNHVLSLEDDFSFYQRQGQSWKVVSLDVENEKISLEPVGNLAKDGINTPYTFDIDAVTRVWRGRQMVDLAEIAPGVVVQLNLAWSQGWRNKEYSVEEIWLDQAGRDFAREMQLRRHVRFQRQRWVPGWIDEVERFDFGGGEVTLTFFRVDPSLLAEFKQEQADGFGVACAEKTLRTWFHRGDKKIGKVIAWNELPDPPIGSSGVQVRLKFTELLEGYRPGNCVRIKCHSWKFVTMPPEERITSVEEQRRDSKLGLP